MERIVIIDCCRVCNRSCGIATMQYKIPSDCPLETLAAHDNRVRKNFIEELAGKDVFSLGDIDFMQRIAARLKEVPREEDSDN